MPRAAILTFDGCYASSVAGFADILQIANSHLKLEGAPASALFDWRFVSPSGETAIASNGLALPTHKVGPRERYDLVFVPSFHYGGHRQFDQFLSRHADACTWMTAQWQSGAWVAANCTGTFILAQTGLLDERTATTTWWLERQFREKFPRVDLQLRPVLTEMDRLICAGASASYLLQTIRVIERFAGPVIASQCAKAMLIDVSQTSQIPYLPLLAQKSHSDALVHRAQRWLQSKMTKDLKITELADALAVSDRTLIRRFRSVLDQTPLAYLQDLRLEAARALLETSSHSVEEVASQVGYSDTSSFSRLFRQRIGMSPGAYRGRFQVDVSV
ncbi:MAG: GlxA family transcriptional regulator [Pseudomonadales bacterium]|jgi:transcriptional regulator GlxA family with amidase domain|uniref:GlxA family transcriptional regulator n=1 Tax=Delftia acidovorans TaxID=80866 RepID=UPI000F4C50E5|nr:helix-turn-helix domain-containing protein [Delftia acidovorans]ROR02445.1 AraC family transcriptional regulator with amidase-like domain [Delftia acidovorans]